MEYYYTGQFGYFNVILLPLLENYNGPTLTIYTFPDYIYILNNLLKRIITKNYNFI